MQLQKINGNTYFIAAPTNIGVFLFKDKYTLLIDSGNNNQQARKISEILSDENMNVKYIINTHSHIDHSGGNGFFKEHFPGSILYSSEAEKIFIENDQLFPIYLYGASPIRSFEKHFVKGKNVLADFTVQQGTEKINNEKFEIIALPGHANGQIGIGTKDRVCFLGDALFSQEIMDKYRIPFLFDIEAQFETYQMIKELDYDYYVLSHSSQIYSQEEIKDLAKSNIQNLNEYIDMLIELLHQPKTREEVTEEIIILEELSPDFDEYHFIFSTIGAIISYLYETQELSFQIENGRLYYYIS